MNRWRTIIPAAFLMYTIAYIDRTNFSLAIPALQRDFGLAAGGAGVAAGVFFVGYVLFQMPGGYIAQRWSAKQFIFWALLVWGAFATLCGFAQSYSQLLLYRFLLGVGEGGVWPATVVLLSNWFPPEERARANGYWVVCQPVAILISGPLSGWLLDRYDWRMMFIVQGVLPLFYAAVWWWVVKDRPPGTKDEAMAIEKTAPLALDFGFLKKRSVWILAALDIAFACGAYGLLMWLPSAIRALGVQDNLTIGVLSGLPYFFAALGAIYNSRRSDRLKERHWHVALPCLLAGVSLLLSALLGIPLLGLLLVCVTATGIYAAIGPMWALMSEVVPKSTAGLSLGLINAFANLGGLAGPYVVGALRDRTGSFVPGVVFLSACLLTAGLLTLTLRRQECFAARANDPESS
jgi:MFS family permease